MTNKKLIRVVEKTANGKRPVWNEILYLPLPDSSEILAVCTPTVKELQVSNKYRRDSEFV